MQTKVLRMSVSDSPTLLARAHELRALLEEHQRAVAHLVAAWPDARAYETVVAQLEHMRRLRAAVLGVDATWAELLIAHAELVQALWRVPAGNPAALSALGKASERHARAVFALHARLQERPPGAIPA